MRALARRLVRWVADRVQIRRRRRRRRPRHEGNASWIEMVPLRCPTPVMRAPADAHAKAAPSSRYAPPSALGCVDVESPSKTTPSNARSCRVPSAGAQKRVRFHLSTSSHDEAASDHGRRPQREPSTAPRLFADCVAHCVPSPARAAGHRLFARVNE
ncbi:unnamed protein product (mitochondrion) [Plasmodiophora brassicae]|uniref:Uncharacterized protein n=1 Tax=Plasmodiophora brassicae TaxID=37360 RepID=A0A3P3YNV4_PLABS|nr:unnamed protein product [Plasmodiophora brassicae]